MVKKSLLLSLASALFGSAVSAHEGHKCTHDTRDKPEPEIGSELMEDMDLYTEGRTLQEYPRLRMAGNTDALADQTQAFQDYIKNDILPPTLSYFSNALGIITPFASNLKFSSSQATICSIATPAEVKKGMPIDFYYMIDAQTDTSSNWVADSYSCFLTSNTKRPYVGRTVINTDQFPIATNDVLLHEKNMICIMHELTHVLGFSTSSYKYFMYANRTKITGHVTSYTLDGESGGIMNIEPLTTRVRNFFGCSSLKGAYLEAGGGEGTAGSHFERRHFGFEFMTSGLIYQMQVSEFTLAMLEGSGWYAPDYSYADQYQFGQGQGCNFLLAACNPAVFNEWCLSSVRGCTDVGRGGGECASDMRSNGCRYQHPRINYDCENSGGVNYARLPKAENYGRGANSKCFMGTLSSASSAGSSTSFCFKPTCSGTGSSTKLLVQVGSTSVQCTKAGSVTVSGYSGVLTCPDPVEFCNTVGQKKCPRGCMGRGECIDGQCVCEAGFKGTDCSLRSEYAA